MRPIVALIFLAALTASLGGLSCGGSEPPSVEITAAEPTRFFMPPRGDTHATFSITLRPECAIAPGGGIRLEQGYLFHGRPVIGPDVRYAFPDPEIREGPFANRLAVETGGSPFRISLLDAGLGRRSPQVVFPKGFPAGEAVTFVFGDRGTGGPGMAVPSIPIQVRLLCFIDQAGDKAYRLARASHPLIECCAAKCDRLRVVAPSSVRPGLVTVRVVPMAGAGGDTVSSLPVTGFVGEVAIRCGGSSDPVLGRAVFSGEEPFHDVEVSLNEPGIVRLEALSENRANGSLRGTSNPIVVQGGERSVASDWIGDGRILWGSIQNHTAVGGHAASLPSRAFETARGTGCLDYCAITDHSSNRSFRWKELRELPDRYDEPGRFVAFPGYEWTSETHGHRHVILKDGKGTRAASEIETDDPDTIHAPRLADLARLIGSDRNVIITVHHTTWLRDPSFPDYDFGFGCPMPRQLLFEVFSWHGSAETNGGRYPVHRNPAHCRRPGSSFSDVLASGKRFFVTGDSDGHLGLPGIAVAVKKRRSLRYGFSGVTAVCASSFDRNGIFEALEKGRCYGTTGARILAFFRLNGTFPGEESECSGSMRAEIEVHGTAPLQLIQVIRDGTDVVHEEAPGALDFRNKVLLDRQPEDGEHSYYLRVEQADGHQAWITPLWLVK